MALIKCPECGEEISDKAKKCVYCGHVLVEEAAPVSPSPRICTECGAQIEDPEATECPKCGCPLEDEVADAPQNDEKLTKVEVSSVKVSKRVKTIVIGAVAAVAVIALVVFGVNDANQRREEAQRVQQEQAAVKEYNKYVANLSEAKTEMLLGAISAEDTASTVLNIWRSAIYEDNQSDWDADIQKYFATDFNDALANYYGDESVKSTVSSIKSNQDQVKDLMSKLQNPTDELSSAYDAVNDLYDQYIALTNLAVSPSGNYTSYSSNYNDADSGFSTAYDKLDTRIPDKKKE